MALAFLCDGDHFLQYLFTSDASHPNGLLLNPIPAFALDTSRGDYGHEIEDGRWMGAYFRDTRISIRSTFVTKFVPSSELVWLRNLQLPNQVRAVPWGHAGMEASAQLGKALNTLVYQLRIAASMMPIMITDQPLQDVEFGDAMVTDASGNVIQKVEPGLIALGHGIKDVKTVTPNLPSSFDAETFLARVGAGLDISLALLTGRFDKTNFSSGKLEVNMLRESTDFVRDITWLPAMRRIWRKLEAAQRLAGDPYVTQPDHVRIPLPVLDPLKEARAEQIRLATNTLSRSELIKARGRDPMRVFEEIKDEQTDLVKDVTALLGGSISVSED
jgi:capsid protein